MSGVADLSVDVISADHGRLFRFTLSGFVLVEAGDFDGDRFDFRVEWLFASVVVDIADVFMGVGVIDIVFLGGDVDAVAPIGVGAGRFAVGAFSVFGALVLLDRDPLVGAALGDWDVFAEFFPYLGDDEDATSAAVDDAGCIGVDETVAWRSAADTAWGADAGEAAVAGRDPDAGYDASGAGDWAYVDFAICVAAVAAIVVRSDAVVTL